MYCKEHLRAIATAAIFLVLTACSGSSTDTSQATVDEILESPVTDLPVTDLPVTDLIEPPIDSVSPTIPANVRVTNVSTTTISFSWNAATDNVGVVSYRIYKNGSNTVFASTATLSFTDNGLIPGQSYQYRVSAVDAAGNESARSSALTVSTLALPDTTAPSVPSSLRVVNVGTDRVTLAWNASSDNVAVTAYRLYKNGSNTAFATVSSLSYVDTGLASEQTYTYRVSALDAAGNESARSATLTVNTLALPDTTSPSVPSGLRVISTGTHEVSLAWNASSDNVAVTAYRLYKDGSNTAFATVNALSYVDTGLEADQAYTYRVSAIDAAGNESARSTALMVNTQALPDTTAPSVPANLRTTSVSVDSISLAWNASTDNVAVVAYRVYRNGSSTALASTSSLSFSDTGLSAGQTYTYTVSAVDEAGNESSMSGVLSVTTDTPSNPQPVNLSWLAPTQNTDSSCLNGVQGYRLSYGESAGSYQTSHDLTADSGDISCQQVDYDAVCDAPVMRCSYTTEALSPGEWYFVLQAYDLDGVVSDYSNEVVKQVN